MVNPNEFKQKIEKIISQKYRIEFLGDKFNDIVKLLSDTKAEKVYAWIENVFKETIHPISIISKKKYKQWQINELLTFRKELNIANVDYRILFVKIKNSIYI